MMTSTFEISLKTVKMATRPNGQACLETALDALAKNERVVLDFEQRSPTPSFADQCIGGLIESLGFSQFKQRVVLRHVAEKDKPLIRHVLGRRSSNHVPAV